MIRGCESREGSESNEWNKCALIKLNKGELYR
jgi:hypothetical protein